MSKFNIVRNLILIVCMFSIINSTQASDVECPTTGPSFVLDSNLSIKLEKWYVDFEDFNARIWLISNEDSGKLESLCYEFTNYDTRTQLDEPYLTTMISVDELYAKKGHQRGVTFMGLNINFFGLRVLDFSKETGGTFEISHPKSASLFGLMGKSENHIFTLSKSNDQWILKRKGIIPSIENVKMIFETINRKVNFIKLDLFGREGYLESIEI